MLPVVFHRGGGTKEDNILAIFSNRIKRIFSAEPLEALSCVPHWGY